VDFTGESIDDTTLLEIILVFGGGRSEEASWQEEVIGFKV